MDLVCSEIGAVRVLAVQGRIDHAAAAGLCWRRVRQQRRPARTHAHRQTSQGTKRPHRHCCADAGSFRGVPDSRFDLIFSVFDTLDSALVALASV